MGRVYTTASRLVERARRASGPSFLICHTYRFHGHHVGDIDRAYYRSKQEEQEWKTEHDPLKLLAGRLLEYRMADENLLKKLEKDIEGEIGAAVQFALDAPYPEPDEASRHVYA